MYPGQTAAALGALQTAWNEILPQYPLEYAFYDSWLDAMYRDDEKLGTAIALFATLAIVISCMGILGMAIVSTQRRTKEIGIRKVIGASVSGILVMLSKDFAKWIVLANIFALPLAWYAMHHWLQNFAYRIDMHWWLFALSGSIALLLALITVSFQALKTTMMNPTEALRYE
jgi:putative ABC transport system permease protein